MSQVEYPTDVKLLLLQLIHESKEHNHWQDIIDRFTNHPILTQLHNLKNLSLNEDGVSELASTIINSALKQEKESRLSIKRSRGRRPKDENIQNLSEFKLNSKDAKRLSYFQQPNSVGRTLLIHVSTMLHHQRVEEIKKQLDLNKKQFAALLTDYEKIKD